MNSERIKMLEQFVAEDPGDPFNRYALGLELAKFDTTKAREVFDALMAVNPDYVPAYYQAALLYLELGKHEAANAIIKKGIGYARAQANLKTVNELTSLLDDLD